MSTITLELEDDLVALLQSSEEPVERVAKELLVLELYRRRTISSGKAAELLAMPRIAFIEHASRLGIPFFDMTEEEWRREVESVDAWFSG